MSDLRVRATPIPGLLLVDLPLHGDARGWFKENWRQAEMMAAGLPDFRPVQQNVSFNDEVGVTRGIHAEPWDKLVSVSAGRVFAAWVDLRAGASRGRVVTLEMGPRTAAFVPRGVGNAYQTLEPSTAYSYLVNAYWSPAERERSTFVQLADPALGIEWPIPLARAVMSEAGRAHPVLARARPVLTPTPVILGADGQLGRALRRVFPDATALTHADADLGVPTTLESIDWSCVSVVLNAAAYTAVDDAESMAGRREAWAVNATGVGRLTALARAHGVPLVHISSDYVFDGSRPMHPEDEPFSPLNVYGASKAAGDALVATYDRHYLVRTSWVVGNGTNFVATMRRLAEDGVRPAVIDDQHGRLTFAADLAAGIAHLIESDAPYGTYNLTNSGPVQTWAQVAADVFERSGRSRTDVTGVSTTRYAAEQMAGRQMAPRPVHSSLDLAKITRAGFAPPPAADRLAEMLAVTPQ